MYVHIVSAIRRERVDTTLCLMCGDDERHYPVVHWISMIRSTAVSSGTHVSEHVLGIQRDSVDNKRKVYIHLYHVEKKASLSLGPQIVDRFNDLNNDVSGSRLPTWSPTQRTHKKDRSTSVRPPFFSSLLRTFLRGLHASTHPRITDDSWCSPIEGKGEEKGREKRRKRWLCVCSSLVVLSILGTTPSLSLSWPQMTRL